MRRLLVVLAVCLCFPAAAFAETGGTAPPKEAVVAEEAWRSVLVRPHHPASFSLGFVSPGAWLEQEVWIDGRSVPIIEGALAYGFSVLVVFAGEEGPVHVHVYSQNGKHRVRTLIRWAA